MSIHEECGVFGVFSPKDEDVARLAYYGLYALQHRGQESCGIVVNNDGLFHSHKDVGLVGDVFQESVLENFPKGNLAIGHVRYGTTGTTTRKNCQPIEVNHRKGKMAVAHNGNLSNAYELRKELELSGAIFHSTSDTEIIAYLVTKSRLNTPSIEEAVSKAMDQIDGAYSLVLMSAAKLIAVRDPHGFRPLCYGAMKDGSYVVASEDCALQAVGAKFIRDLEPGEMLVISKDQDAASKSDAAQNQSQGDAAQSQSQDDVAQSQSRGDAAQGGVSVKSITTHCKTQEITPCIFEYIYFARPDSVIDGIAVHEARVRAGKILAQRFPADADIVIGVPDSGLDAAQGFAAEAGIPYGIGLIKNKYIGRTFIAPGQDQRLDKVRIKLNAVSSTVKGKKVVMIDDSIVRGTTSNRIVRLLREAGAKEVHMRVSAPPFRHPCYYGTDIDSEEHLIACQHTIEETRKIIGADSLGYLPLEDLKELVLGRTYCDACFSGKYPTKTPEGSRKTDFEGKLSERK